MLITPAWPGVTLLSLLSSLRLAAVSQPQKKNTPSTAPAASPSKPWIENGLNHQAWTACEPVGCSEAILTKARMEKPSTSRYSMATITHWKLAVSRMPRTTIQRSWSRSQRLGNVRSGRSPNRRWTLAMYFASI